MKKIVLASAALALSISINAEELTAKKIADNAIDKDSPAEAVEYVQSEVSRLTVPSEKRATYAFLGSLQEALADYSAAQKSYAQAAGLAAGAAEGMPKKSSERLVLDAVRCALSAGDTENAENYLNSAVRNSKNADVQATIKLYEQWSALSKAQTSEELNEPVAMMKAYLGFDSMLSVRPSLLLTLWYITADTSFASRLNKEFPSSMEAGIVNGKVQIYPAPFWYFLPRKTAAVPVSVSEPETKTTAVKEETKNSEPKESSVPQNSEKATKLQLGLFRDKANAQSFADKVKEKGFNAYLHEETKASGTTYYSVVVNETPEGTLRLQLKSAGFECYPIF